jgi:TonB family protein
VLKMYVLPALDAALARGGAIQVIGLERPLSIPIAGAAKAVSWLRRCADEKLTKWGIDPTAYGALRRPPIMTNDDWIKDIDFPDSAADRGKEGQVVARMDVDSTGAVRNCAIAVSSGWDPTDKVVCARAIEKGRFEPAIGQNGEPVAASRIVHVSFRLFNSEFERNNPAP